jgi:dolichyl-phosphate beta-glucosyltransferase
VTPAGSGHTGAGSSLRVTIVVPCFNEAGRLDAKAFAAFARADPRVHFVMVNDGSRDATGTVLQDLASRLPGRVTVLSLPVNRGKAEAVRLGMLDAFAGRPDVAGYVDADLATPLSAIPQLVEVFGERPSVEMVFGSRVKLMGRTIVRRPHRHYLGRVFATVVSMVLGLPIYDTQCGAKLFRVTPQVEELFAEPFSSRWIFDVEIVARRMRALRGHPREEMERALFEYPLMEWRDVRGSKLRFSDFVRAIVELAHIGARYR